MLRRFSRGRHQNIVFSDEKLFDIQQSLNAQNDRIWAEEAPDTEERVVERTQKAESVMVWAAIIACAKTPLVFVNQKGKIDRYVYMGILKNHFFPWADDVFGDEDWCFQQDGAPGHKAIETQKFLRGNCPDFIKVDTHWRNADGEWPPNSPDSNQMDYSVWSMLEEKACKTPHPNVEYLKRALPELNLYVKYRMTKMNPAPQYLLVF
uniref:Tc1-like transposase DDE domain-containing protein n=1 Tax=Ditylenchus dipsaci TaxID=166011 RepID=A0A915ED33_9BILA